VSLKDGGSKIIFYSGDTGFWGIKPTEENTSIIPTPEDANEVEKFY
jgi:hypothetical protein